MSSSGYYSWLRRGPSRWAAADRQLLPLMQQISEDSHGRYGVRRMKAALQRQGHQVSLKGISRFMSSAGLSADARRGRIHTTRADGSTVASDLAKHSSHSGRREAGDTMH